MDDERQFIFKDDGDQPCIVVLPFAHFMRLRKRSGDQGWWGMKDRICTEIQVAIDLPENPSIRDMIEFGQR